MSSELHARIKALFLEACEQPPEARARFLERVCGADGVLHREVQALLAADAELETSPMEDSILGQPDETLETIDGYRLVRRVGEGGMGEVWEAEQLQPVRRHVAIKLVKWGMNTKEVVARFEFERQSLALMNHLNIARVYDAGATEGGRPYFVMEYVEGEPITTYCDRHGLSTAERLRLFVQVCEGVQHAHQKGVIHRDMKPSNVLVTRQDDRPLIKIIDFGIAKATNTRLTERVAFTRFGQWIGTAEYMSPEQAGLDDIDIDTRTDVYSLGVILYELLVGAHPLDRDDLRRVGFDEMRRRIREDHPQRPSTKVSSLGVVSGTMAKQRATDPRGLKRLLRGDLDWIVMKALEKDRSRRYPSPSELAADIERHLQCRPVSASPPGALYLSRKFVGRHRVGVVASALVVAALLGGLGLATAGFVSARRAERQALVEAETAERVLGFLVGTYDAVDPISRSGLALTGEGLLSQSAERIREELVDQPEVQARVMARMGRAYRNLGRYDEAQPLLEEALALRARLYGNVHPDVADSLEILGLLQYSTGDFAAARTNFERTVAIRERLFGPDDPAVARGLTSLGATLCRAGEYERSRVSLARALAIWERSTEPPPLALGDTLFLKGLLHQYLGEFDESRRLLERALVVREEAVGPEHSIVGDVLEILGLSYGITHELERSQSLLERAVANHEAALGPDHPHLARTHAYLGETLSKRGDHEAAARHFERAVVIATDALEPDHPDVGTNLMLYGMHHLRTGDLAGARDLFERALAIAERTYGTDHAEVVHVLRGFGKLEYLSGNFGKAREHYLRVLSIEGEAFGTEHGKLASTFYNLACLSVIEGKHDRALAELKNAVDRGFAGEIILTDPDLAALHGNPEFETILADVRKRRG